MEVFELRSRSLERQSSTGSPRRSRMSCLLAIAGIAFVTSFTLILFNFLIGHKELSEELEVLQLSSKETLVGRRCESEFCTSKSCITSASRMLDIMDNTTDPCEDFYQYACGGYKKKRNVRYNEDYYSPEKETLDNILVNIKRLMEKTAIPDESEALRKTKEIYASCMNTSQRNEMNLPSLNAWLRRIKVHIDASQPSEEDLQLENYGSWRLILAELEKYQIHTVLKPDFKMTAEGSLERIEVDCLVPVLSPDTYLSPSEEDHAYNLMLYKEVIENMFRVLDVDKDKRKEYIDGIIQLETELSRAIRRSPTSGVPELSAEHKQQLKEIWRPLIGEIEFSVEVKSTCQYNLQNMLSALNSGSPEHSARYVIWRMMSQLMQYMGVDFLDLHLHYLARLPGSNFGFLSPWKECSNMVRKELGAVVAKGLVDEGYFTEHQLSEVREMFWEMKAAFGHVLRIIPFLDDITRDIFLEKLKTLKIAIGFPREVYSSSALDSLLSEFEVNSSNPYLLNFMDFRRFKTQHFFRMLKTNNNEGENEGISLEHNPLGQTSSYDYITNTVKFDLGLLRPPLYDFAEDYPKYLKYSQALLLAHELSHGFDTFGNFYDSYGNRFADLDWWPVVVRQKFHNFTLCLIGQHLVLTRTSPRPVANITELPTLNNVIADLGAFFTTFAGLSIHLQAQGSFSEEKPIPGITLTKKQAYFLKASQTLCELRSKPSLETRDKYTMPPNIRINGALMNTEDFGSVFNCPVGSPMNPALKCNLLR